jgi:hypothetical protein
MKTYVFLGLLFYLRGYRIHKFMDVESSAL